MAKIRLSCAFGLICGPGFARNCALAWFDRASSIPCEIVKTPMTLSVAHAGEQTSPRRGLFDGRTERHGEKFFVDPNSPSGLLEPDTLFRRRAHHRMLPTRSPPQ